MKCYDENSEFMNVLADYSYALDILDRYDCNQLKVEDITPAEKFHATYDNAMEIIVALKERFGKNTLFANEKDGSFRSSIGQIYQTFDGRDKAHQRWHIGGTHINDCRKQSRREGRDAECGGQSHKREQPIAEYAGNFFNFLQGATDFETPAGLLCSVKKLRLCRGLAQV